MTHDEMIAVIQAHKEGKAIVEYDSTDKERIVPKDFISWNFNEYCYEIAEILPQKFKKGDKVKIEGVSSIGQVKRYKSGFVVVDYGQGDIGCKEEFLQPYIPLTREEITAQWVVKNDVKAGDRLKVVDCYSKHFGKETTVNGISEFGIHTDLDFLAVEVFQKLNLKVVPFSFEDRELFRNKWVRRSGEPFSCTEFLITFIGEEKIKVGSDFYTYEEAIEMLEFIDGKPFGKEVWS